MTPSRAIIYKLSSVVLFTVMAAFIKAASDHVPPGQTVFYRSFFALPVIVAWLGIRGQLRGGLKTRNPMGHLWRGLIGSSAMGLGFAALGMLPLPEVTAIGFAAPLLVVIFAAIMLGERVRLFRLASVGLGLAGVLIVISPRLTGIGEGAFDDRATLGAMLMLGSAVFRALAQIQIRRLVKHENPAAIAFWFLTTTSLLSALSAPFDWVWPTPTEAWMLIGAGLFGGAAQIVLTLAYRYGEAALVAPFDYASMLLALVVGYFVFDEVPTLVMLIGAALVIAAGVLIIWRERQLGLERGKARDKLTPQG